MSVGPLKVCGSSVEERQPQHNKILLAIRQQVRKMDAWSIRRDIGSDPESKSAETERYYMFELYEKLRASDILAKLIDGPTLLPDIVAFYPPWQRWLLARNGQTSRTLPLRLVVHNLDWYLLPGTSPRPLGLIAAAGSGIMSSLILIPQFVCGLSFVVGVLTQSLTAGVVWLVSLAVLGPVLLLQHYYRAHMRRLTLHVEVLLQHIDELLIREEL